MKPGATFVERFDGWFVKPIEKLKELPEGDGGFLALSAALFLCERYYRTLANTHEGSRDDESFKDAAAKDLGIRPEDFKIFWKVYRHGVQHQGMPKRVSEDGVTYKWHIDYGSRQSLKCTNWTRIRKRSDSIRGSLPN